MKPLGSGQHWVSLGMAAILQVTDRFFLLGPLRSVLQVDSSLLTVRNWLESYSIGFPIHLRIMGWCLLAILRTIGNFGLLFHLKGQA